MSVYSLPAYGRMIGDPRRFGAYRRALESAIRPGCRVLDLGSGPGVFSLVAARLGAGEVWAVDTDPSVELVSVLAERNGLDDRIRALRCSSADLEPAEPFDVIVSDLRGVLPFFGRHLPSIVDARKRLLAPGGVLVPAVDELWIAPVHAPGLHAHLLGGFEGGPPGPGSDLELDLEPARELASHHWCRAELDADACLRPPRRLGELDYRTLESPHFEGRAEWPAGGEEPGAAEQGTVDERPCHGLAAWFDGHLSAAGPAFSNAPSEHLLYGQAFFPLPEPRILPAAARATADFSAHLVGDDYVFGWFLELADAEGGSQGVRRSTFYANPIDPSALARRATDHRPRPTEDRRALAWLLSRIDGETTLGELAEGLVRTFPGRFSSLRRALSWAADALELAGGERGAGGGAPSGGQGV